MLRRRQALALGLASIAVLAWPLDRALAQAAPKVDWPEFKGTLSGPMRFMITQAPMPPSAPRLMVPPPAPYASRNIAMLAPSLPETDPGLGIPRGWRLGEWEIRVRNRGDVALNFSLVNAGRTCAEETVAPGTEILLLPCGGRLAWHDGRSVRSIALLRGARYEMSWGDGSWNVAPLHP